MVCKLSCSVVVHQLPKERPCPWYFHCIGTFSHERNGRVQVTEGYSLRAESSINQWSRTNKKRLSTLYWWFRETKSIWLTQSEGVFFNLSGETAPFSSNSLFVISLFLGIVHKTTITDKQIIKKKHDHHLIDIFTMQTYSRCKAYTEPIGGDVSSMHRWHVGQSNSSWNALSGHQTHLFVRALQEQF